eukprot:964616-Prorocentrum_minimum.AAC.1
MLRCAMLCYAVLRCATLCYAVLCCTTLCCAVLRYAAMCYAVLRCTALCYAVLRCATLRYAVLRNAATKTRLCLALLSRPTDHFSQGERQVRAQAVYPLAARINHACMPNVARFDYVDQPGPDNLKLHMRTLDHIPAGTELVQSYFPISQHYAARRDRLVSIYGFECACARCVHEAQHQGSEEEESSEEEEEEAMEEGGGEARYKML